MMEEFERKFHRKVGKNFHEFKQIVKVRNVGAKYHPDTMIQIEIEDIDLDSNRSYLASIIIDKDNAQRFIKAVSEEQSKI
jgi:hypothetical protein